jgi:hypothetical protein
MLLPGMPADKRCEHRRALACARPRARGRDRLVREPDCIFDARRLSRASCGKRRGWQRSTHSLWRSRKHLRKPAPTLYDVLTIVTELVANGVRHGDGRYVRLHLSVAGGSVLGEVENSGRAMPRPREIAPDGSGMGLHIVDAIANERHVILDDDSTIVRFVVAPPAAQG